MALSSREHPGMRCPCVKTTLGLAETQYRRMIELCSRASWDF
jgi:hypothetical protein